MDGRRKRDKKLAAVNRKSRTQAEYPIKPKPIDRPVDRVESKTGDSIIMMMIEEWKDVLG